MSKKVIRLLLVEDNDTDALVAREELLDSVDVVFEMARVNRLRSALSLLERETFDVVVLDLTLPDSDGLDTFLKFRAAAPNLPVVVASHHSAETIALQAVQAGAQDYLVKGSTKGMLARTIRYAIERAKTQMALRDSEKRLNAVVESAMDAIISIDQQQLIIVFNASAEKMFGYPAEAVMGQTLDILIPQVFRARHQKHLDGYAASGDTVRAMGEQLELKAVRANGEEFPIEASIAKIDLDGQAQYTAIVRDTTRLKQVQAQLIQTQKLESLTQLSGGLAHDFNNILAIITGNLEMVTLRLGEDEKSLQRVQAALSAVNRGADITRRMLSFSSLKVDADSTLYAQDIHRLLGEMLVLLKRTLGPSYNIHFNDSRQSLWVLLDPSEFENVILNLAINARDAMPTGGRIDVQIQVLELADNEKPGLAAMVYAHIEFSDKGSGMEPEVLRRAFEPFYTTKIGLGSGLGLAMAYSFARKARGAIEIESTVGVGTCFHLYLPITDAPLKAVKTRSSATMEGGNECILMVDDEPDILELAQEQLSQLGYRILTATDANMAWELLLDNAEIDLLLTDVVMPGGLLGTELAVKAQRLRPTMRVLLCSGFPKKIADDPQCRKYVKNILAKPYRMQELAVRVRQILDAPV